MSEKNETIHNLVIEVSSRSKGGGGRKVTVPYSQNNNQPSMKEGARIQPLTQSSDRRDSKKDKNYSRQGHHPQSGNRNPNSNQNYKNSFSKTPFESKRVLVSRERSFMKVNQKQSSGNGKDSNPGPQDSRIAGVQRQKSCVANLYSGQGRNNPPTSLTMPAATTTCPRVKPTMQLYRPPTLRAPGDLSPGPYPSEDSPDNLKKPGLNINAKEFVSLTSPTGDSVSFSGPNGPTPSALKHSKSAGKVVPGTNGWDLSHSKSGGQIGSRMSRGPMGASPPLRVHFTDDTITYDPDNKIGMAERDAKGTNGSPIGGPIKRSKSVGSASDLVSKNGLLTTTQTMDFVPSNNVQGALQDLGTFSEETKAKFNEVLQSPNSSSARVIMDVVTELFSRITQASKHGEPAARYCIAVIEKESSTQTFLETLLNTCQEYYQERDQLLRGSSPTRYTQGVPHTHTKWIAYMTFLHEMYSQVKRRQRISVSSTAPGILLLTLLAECCVVSLEDHAAGGASLTQIECLFFILTGVGRDIETELPPLMGKVMSAARDCLFSPTKSPAMKKTLLQLIEMNAASWQLPAQAVMYYYPTVGK